jgi:proline dehydrogenase
MIVSKDLFEDTQTAYRLYNNEELHHARNLFRLFNASWIVSMGASIANFTLRVGLPFTPLFRHTVYNHFCGGETFEECKETIKSLSDVGVSAMINYGVELKETERDFELTIKHNLEAIEFAGKNSAVSVVCIKITGFGRFSLLEKVHNRGQLTDEEATEFLSLERRVEQLCAAAAYSKVALYVDAEESWIQDALDELVERKMEEHNKIKAVVFNTFQMYRHDRLVYLKSQVQKAKSGGYILGVKLVRGAYMEKERVRANELGYESPIHANKQAVDEDFNAAVMLCLENLEYVSLCIASQSEESNLLTVKMIEEKGIARNHPQIWFSQLYGMGDNITFNLANAGFNAAKYLPYGPVKDVIPYLIRRAQENTSVAGQMSRELTLINKEVERRKRLNK